jgi:hypothetical protein
MPERALRQRAPWAALGAAARAPAPMRGFPLTGRAACGPGPAMEFDTVPW